VFTHIKVFVSSIHSLSPDNAMEKILKKEKETAQKEKSLMHCKNKLVVLTTELLP